MQRKETRKGIEDAQIRNENHPLTVSQTEGCILQEVAFVAAYVIKPGLFQLTEHYIRESKAYYNNLHLTKNNGQIYS